MTHEEYPKIYLYRRIVQSKLFIDDHYDGLINLDNIVEEAFFSKFHFIRLFKKTYGKTPHQYLTTVRIDKAKELLKTDILISQVCYLVGFDSITSFTDLFKRVVGKTPSAYQIQKQKIQEEIARIPLKYIPNCFAEKKGWNAQSNK